MALAMAYGACMGSFAVFKGEGPSYWQVAASIAKVPLLFFLTLVVTLPSLYVFNALIGSRLAAGSVVRLLAAAMGVTIAVLASLGPIVAFFSVSTTSYSSHGDPAQRIAVFAASGSAEPDLPPPDAPAARGRDDAPGLRCHASRRRAEEVRRQRGRRRARDPSATDHGGRPSADASDVRVGFRCWVVLFGLVGAQMGWVLRPFIGDPLRTVRLVPRARVELLRGRLDRDPEPPHMTATLRRADAVLRGRAAAPPWGFVVACGLGPTAA